MIKTENIEIRVYYCDNCGERIPTLPGEEVETFPGVNGENLHLCGNCWNNVPTCYECCRTALSDNDLFSNDAIYEGHQLCVDCLSDGIHSVKKAVSAAEIFLQRHKVE